MFWLDNSMGRILNSIEVQTMKVRSGGGFRAIKYTFQKSREAGGLLKLYRAMRSRNACKTCALGMGGQKGGMVNERGKFPEVCKKSLQAMVADMQPAISPDFWRTHSVDELKHYSPRQLEKLGRLSQPLRFQKGKKYYEPVGWEEALHSIASQLNHTAPDRSFFYFSGRSSNEAGFSLQLLARLFGTNHVNNCSYYCHQASGVGLQSSIGSGTATILLEDLENADCVFLIGGNPASNHPRLMTSLMHVRRRGGKVVVINPVRETGLVKFRIPSDPRSLLFGTKIATHYVRPHIGGDLALLWGIAKCLNASGAVDLDFLNNHCNGYEQWMESARGLSWEEIENKSGVSREEIESLADVYAKSNRCVFAWTMGITHHTHGVQNVQSIANLALCRGMVGKPSAGLMPIRGHSNVQGIGSVGVTPSLKKAIFEELEKKLSLELPTMQGKDTLACIEAAHDKEMDVGVFLGGNLYGSNPDSSYAAEGLSRLKMSVMLNTTLNTGHFHGLAEETYILPVLARDEEPAPTTQESMFNFVRLSDGGPSRLMGPKSELEVVANIGCRLEGTQSKIDWESMSSPDRVRQWIGSVVPGYSQISGIGESKKEFQISGRTFHQPTFPTPDGKAQMHVHPLPSLKGTSAGELRLMTVRSEGQFNTVVYEEEDLYRNQDGRDVVLINPSDVERFQLQHNQRVTVKTDTGSLGGIRVRSFEEIRAGNALMYYPEANVLIPRQADPSSRTPAFKGIVIKIQPET